MGNTADDLLDMFLTDDSEEEPSGRRYRAGDNSSDIDDMYRKQALGKDDENEETAADRVGNANPNESDSWGDNMQQKQHDRNQDREAAADKLKNSENNALKGPGGSTQGSNNKKGGTSLGGDKDDGGALGAAKNAESSGIKNNVVGKNGAGDQKGSSATKAAGKAGGKATAANPLSKRLKKMGPMGGIIGIIIAVISTLSGAMSLSPFGLLSNGMDQFNVLRTSMSRRTTYFQRYMMDDTRNKPITKNSMIFGKEKFKISKRMQKKLAKNNISYFDADGTRPRMLVYTDMDTGKTFAIAANDTDVSKLPRSMDLDGVNIEFSERVKIDDALDISPNFFDDLNRSTRTMKGHVAGWFDSTAKTFIGRLTSRNKFRDVDDGDTDVDEKVKQGAHNDSMDDSLGSTEAETDDDKGAVKDKDTKTTTDPDGNTKTTEVIENIDEGSSEKVSKGSSVDTDAVGKNLKARAQSAVASVGGAANIGCAVLKAYSAINAAVAAVQVAKIINYITGFLEAAQKAQSGDGGAELHYYMNSLSQKGNTVAYDENGDKQVVREGTSSLESPAYNQFFSNGSMTIDPNDPVAKKYNREQTMSIALSEKSQSGLGGGMLEQVGGLLGSASKAIAAYKTCNAIQAGAALASMGIEIGTLVVSFFTFGAASVVKSAIKDTAKIIKKNILNMAVSAIAATVISVVVPMVVSFLATDLIENMAGEDAAYVINNGFNMYSGKSMQASSGRPGTEAEVVAQYQDTQEVIAAEAEFARHTHSPFDVTNKYTFLGSIMNSLTPLALSLSSPLSTMTSTINTVGSALSSLSPTAKADGEVKFRMSLNRNCPALSQLGLVGDAYCNPYFVSGYTLGGSATAIASSDYYASYIRSNYSADPTTVFNQASSTGGGGNFVMDGEDNVDTDGDGVDDAYNPPVKEDSDLAKWIIGCVARESQFGELDSNVENAIAYTGVDTGNATLDGVINGGIGSISILGDVEDIAEAASSEANLEYSTGERCVAADTKAYAQYTEDQRLMEGAGMIEESSVTAYLNNYYEQHPLDNSPEGIIARYSGMSPEKVDQTLGLIEYVDYVAHYDPSDRGPNLPPVENDWQYESNEVIAKEPILNALRVVYMTDKYIVYDVLRDRTKVA